MGTSNTCCGSIFKRKDQHMHVNLGQINISQTMQCPLTTVSTTVKPFIVFDDPKESKKMNARLSTIDIPIARVKTKNNSALPYPVRQMRLNNCIVVSSSISSFFVDEHISLEALLLGL